VGALTVRESDALLAVVGEVHHEEACVHVYLAQHCIHLLQLGRSSSLLQQPSWCSLAGYGLAPICVSGHHQLTMWSDLLLLWLLPCRLRQAGLPRPSRVFMVSALNGLGVKEMVRSLKDDMGFRADLWVVGAQNGEHNAELGWLCWTSLAGLPAGWLPGCFFAASYLMMF
jgi:hypothetical protein